MTEPRARQIPDVRVVIITGFSGSGKSTAIRALEDLGYFCIDNLPVPLLRQFLFLWEGSAGTVKQVAIGIDVRERMFLDQAVEVISQLQSEGYQVEICFLESDEEVLLRRYQETRRVHPLAGTDVSEGIRRELELLRPLRERAQLIIETSGLNIHQLKQVIRDHFGSLERANLQILLMSFGFKYGIPRSADYLFDVRYIPNPYFVDELRPLSGLDLPVQGYVMQQPATRQLLTHLNALLRFVVQQTNVEGRSRLTISVGCTGGQHRSVAIVEELRGQLGKLPGVAVNTLHRDIAKRKA